MSKPLRSCPRRRESSIRVWVPAHSRGRAERRHSRARSTATDARKSLHDRPRHRRPVRRLRLRDAAVPAVGRAVGHARDDEFRQPRALRLRDARRLRHRHADEQLRLAVPRHAAVRVPRRRAGQRRARAHALPPALSRERSRPGAAHHRARLHVGRGRGLYLRHRPAAGADAVLPARLGRRSSASASASTGCSWSASRWRSRCCWSLALEYTRFGAQVRAAVDNQRMARGLGINVDGAFAVTFALGCGLAGLGGALAIEIVGLDPSFALHLPGLCADRGVGRRARLDRRLVRRRDPDRHQRRRRQILRAASSAPS